MGDQAELNNDEFEDLDEDIIELTDPLYEDEVSEEDMGDQDIIELVDMVEEGVPTELHDLSDLRIQAALEKIITERYGERIDDLLFSVMEKLIQKEIHSLKKILVKELSDADKPSFHGYA